MSGIQIAGQATAYTADQHMPVLVQVRSSTESSWRLISDAVPISCEAHAGSEGVDGGSFRVPFGPSVKGPADTSMAIRSRESLRGLWCRFVSPSSLGAIILVEGLIESVETLHYGRHDSAPAGWLTVHVRGIGYALRTTRVATSHVLDESGSGTVEVRSLRSFNGGKRGLSARGNRSEVEVGSSYVFGGSEVWTRAQALRYLLARYAPLGLTWTLHGDTSALSGAHPGWHGGPEPTLAELIDSCAPRSLGVDWRASLSEGAASTIVATLDVFVTSVASSVFGSSSVSGTSRRWELDVSTDRRVIELSTSEDATRSASRIAAIGERIVVCGTLSGADGSLVGAWSADAEASFLRGDPSILPSEEEGEGRPTRVRARAHDDYRSRDELSDVFRRYRIADGVMRGLSPTVNEDGTISLSGAPPTDAETLPWIPLKAGTDYSADSPVASWTRDDEAELVAPFAVLDGSLSEDLGVGVSALRGGIGVALHGPHRCYLARGSMTPDGITDAVSTVDTSSWVAGSEATVTLAWRTEERAWREWRAPPGSDDGPTEVIFVPGVELWLLAPGTVLAPGVTSPQSWTIVRDDRDTLDTVLAGALQRHADARQRAVLVLRGVHPVGGTLGAALSVAQGGDVVAQHGIVTSVYWDLQQVTTRVQTGYA